MSGGDCQTFVKRLLEENFGAGVMLLHNKRHGAAVIDAAESFIVVDSTARAAFAFAKGAQWANFEPSPSRWLRTESDKVILDGLSFEAVEDQEFTPPAHAIQFGKVKATVLLR